MRSASLNEVNTNISFLRLEDLLLSPPLPAIVSVLIVVGTFILSTCGARWFKCENKTPAELAAVFVLITGLLAAVVHAVAWTGYACLPILRSIAWVLAALGMLQLTKWKPSKLVSVPREYWREGSSLDRSALIVSLLTLLGLFAAALGPATDTDSLDYHLAVPLDWLRHGGAYPRPDWFSATYVGLGESLNMLGLAAGTDGLGAAFQAAGLVVALIAVTAFARSRTDRLFAVLLVVACPVITTLVTAQKPQLLPAAALTVALVILIKRFKTFDLSTALLAFGCAGFAMVSKHSFLLTGTVVLFVGLLAAVRTQRLGLAFLVLGGCFAIFAVPVFARNFVFYGDPLSPLLERWRPGGNPTLIRVAAALRDKGEGVTFGSLARLPWSLTATLNPRILHDLLGIGVFGFLLGLRERGPTRQLFFAALAAFVLLAAFAPLEPRYFFEPYLWAAAAVAAVGSRPSKSLFLIALTVQAALVAGVAIYLAAVFFPGALTQTGRDRVMTLTAPGYAEAKWLDATLPANAVVYEEFRSRLFLPRPFVVGQVVASMAGDQPYVIGDRLVFLKDVPDWKQQLTEFMKEKRVTALVTRYPIESPPFSWLAENYGTPLSGPAEFRSAGRSPFNRGRAISWIVTSLNVDVPVSQSQ